MVTNAIMTDITTVMHATLHPWSYSKFPISHFTWQAQRHSQRSQHVTATASSPSSANTMADESTGIMGMLQKGHLLEALNLDKQERHTNLSENPFSTS